MRRILFYAVLMTFAALFFAGCSDSTEPVPRVATPVFNIVDGVYTEAQTVYISSATAGAEIRFTTDGSDPNIASTVYTEPLLISESTVIKAIAFKDDMEPSRIAVLNVLIDEELEVGSIAFVNVPESLAVNTELLLSVMVYDTEENPITDGTVVTFSATRGFFLMENMPLPIQGRRSSSITLVTEQGVRP